MKIAFVISSLGNYAPGLIMSDICKYLIQSDYECKVFYFDSIENELEFPCPVEKINIYKMRQQMAGWDIIHSHTFRADAYTFFYKILYFRTASKFVSTLHNPISYTKLKYSFASKFKAFWYSLFWPIVLLNKDVVTVLSSYLRDMLRKQLYRFRRIEVIYNGRDVKLAHRIADESDALEINRLKNRYKLIGSVARITKVKGLDQIIRALPKLPDYAFLAVGDGPELDNLKQLAADLKVADRCCFLGYRANATDYYYVFNIFSMCSYSEGFPLALIEASAYGIPTILSDIPILKSVISENEVCFYKVGDIDSYVDSVQKITPMADEYSRRIKLYYEEKLTANRMGGRYKSIYESL